MKNIQQFFKEYFKSVADIFKPGSGPLRAAVLAGRSKFYCVLAKDNGSGTQYLKPVAADIGVDIYGAENTGPAGIENIRQNISDLAAGIKQEYAIINIVIPDPAAALSVFKPGSPGAAADRRDILRLKSSEKLGVTRDRLSFFMSDAKSTGPEAGSFAFSSKKVHTETIRGLLYDAGLSPSASAPGIAYLLDALSGKINGAKGALFLVEPEYWTFFIWGSEGRPLYMISRWFEPGVKNAAALKGAVSEAERRLRAYAAANRGFDIEKIYTAGAGGLAGAAAGLIKDRFDRECVELDIPGMDGAGKKQGISGLPVSLIAAAGA
jgi:hypothetical protein